MLCTCIAASRFSSVDRREWPAAKGVRLRSVQKESRTPPSSRNAQALEHKVCRTAKVANIKLHMDAAEGRQREDVDRMRQSRSTEGARRHGAAAFFPPGSRLPHDPHLARGEPGSHRDYEPGHRSCGEGRPRCLFRQAIRTWPRTPACRARPDAAPAAPSAATSCLAGSHPGPASRLRRISCFSMRAALAQKIAGRARKRSATGSSTRPRWNQCPQSAIGTYGDGGSRAR